MKVNRKDLLSRCETARPAIRSSSSMPALSFLWFRGGYVYGYDGGLGIACALPAGVEFEGGVAGATLLDLLSSSNKETVELTPNEDGFALKIGGSRAKIVSTPIDRFFWNFPLNSPDKGEPLFELSNDIIAAIKAVLPVKHDAPRIPEHHGVVMSSDGKQTWFFTTDTYAIAAYLVDEETPEGKNIMPRAFAQQVVKHGLENHVIWKIDDALSMFAGQTVGQIQVHSNSLDTDDVKDLAQVVLTHSRDAGDGVRIPPGLTEALSRAEILAGKDAPTITFESSGETLTVRGKYEGGNLHEDLELDEGESLPERSIQINSSLLIRGLPLATHIAIGESSVVLYGSEGKYTYVLASVD